MFDPKALEKRADAIQKLHNEILFNDARVSGAVQPARNGPESEQYFFLCLDALNTAESYLRLAILKSAGAPTGGDRPASSTAPELGPRKPYVKEGSWVAEVGDKFRATRHTLRCVIGDVVMVVTVNQYNYYGIQLLHDHYGNVLDSGHCPTPLYSEFWEPVTS